MVKAIRVHRPGGPEVLTYEDMDLGAPGPGQVRVRHTAIGVNYIDTYFRSGLYPAPAGMPFVLGNEGAGEVVAVGEGVSGLHVGDRVAYAATLGAYAEERNIDAKAIVKTPPGVSDETAAAMMLKGLTAQYLLRRTFHVKPGDTILFHAAAGGVGLIACQWAKHLGCTVIGTVGSDDKARLARVRGHRRLQSRHSGPERLALRHPPDPVHPHRQARDPGGDGGRPVRGGGERRGENPGAFPRQAEGRGGGASGARGAPDHRGHRAPPVITG